MPDYPVRRSHPYHPDASDEPRARPPYDGQGQRAAAPGEGYGQYDENSRSDGHYGQSRSDEYHRDEYGRRPGYRDEYDNKYDQNEYDQYENQDRGGYERTPRPERERPVRSDYSLQNRDRQAQEEFPQRGFGGRPEREAGYRGKALGPLTAATTGMMALLRGNRRSGVENEPDQHGLRHAEEKDLNTQGRRSSFFDMESEAPDLGWTSGDQKRAPGNGASFPSLGGSRNGPPPRAQSFRQPKRRRPRLPLIAGALVVLLAICGVAYALGGGDDEPDTTATPGVIAPSATAAAEPTKEPEKKPATTGAEKKVGLGVYKGTSPNQVSQFGTWLGRKPAYAMDYSMRTKWEEIAAPTYMLNTWQGSGYQMVYAVAMLPTRDSSATLKRGAAGEYDRHFERLAKNLVAHDQGDAILRLGWEFNVDWPWHPSSKDRKDFIKYWRSIVDTMRAVPGAEDLKFDWNVNNGGETYDSTIYYPGNKYVDYIGVDVYDISWAEDTYPYPAGCKTECKLSHQQKAWANIMDATFGLTFWSRFAQSKEKPLSLPEWGMWDRSLSDGHGGADNAYFVEQMYKFIDDPRNNVGYQIYFDVDVGNKGDHRLESMSKGGKKFQKLFGK